MTIAMKKIIQYVVVLMTIFYIGNYAKCTQSHNIFNSVEQNVLGEKIWVCNLDSKSDIVTVSIGFKNCGFHNDPVNKQGLLFLTLEMISSGGKGDFDEENYKKNKNSIGAKISTSIEHDYVGVTIRAPRENILEAIDLVKKQALKIKFDEDKFYKMQNQIGSMLINIANEEAFAQRSLLQSYLSNHPYSYNADGNMSGWQNITLSDIKNYKDKIFAKNNLEIVICAKEEILKDTLIKDIVKEVKQDLAEEYHPKKIEKPKVVNPEKIILMPRHGKESGFIASCMLKSRENKMLSYDHKDYHALLIINRVLGGCRLYSRIWDRIREKMGLVYTISTNISNIDFFPLIACYGRCSNDNTKEVLKLIKEEWGKIHNISENEFNDAKKGIIGSIKVSLIGSLSVANRLLHDKIRGRKINHIDEKIMSIQNITYDDAKAAARHYFDPQKLSFIVVGNAKMAN